MSILNFMWRLLGLFLMIAATALATADMLILAIDVLDPTTSCGTALTAVP